MSDAININATGRTLGSYKSAAKKCGCSVEEWMSRRSAGERRCYRCKTWKRSKYFSIDSTRGSGRASICKRCCSEASTASRYKMTIEELRLFKRSRGNRCEICERSKSLYIDHCHKTGRVRGLLCSGCNTAIGQFKEDPVVFRRAMSYLEKADG